MLIRTYVSIVLYSRVLIAMQLAVTAIYFLLVCNVVLPNPIEDQDNDALDKVDITCTGKVTEKIIYTYAHDKPDRGGRSRLQALEYSAQESIHGNLSQNIRIAGHGDCYDLVIRLRYTLYIL